LKRIKTTSTLEDGVKDATLVIEAIVESLAAKHDLFKSVEKFAPSDAVSVMSKIRLFALSR
jgi:3-hydroxybutyryl-CoA dehydrogenase